MGFIERVSRKITCSRSNERPVSNVSDSSGITNDSILDEKIRQNIDQRGKCQTRLGSVHLDAIKEQPAVVQTATPRPKSVAFPAPRNIFGGEKNSRARRQEVTQYHSSPVQPKINTIVPPTSRLINSNLDDRKTSSKSTRQSADSPPRSREHQGATGTPRGHSNALHRHPSTASSLHSSRSGQQVAFTAGDNQQKPLGDSRTKTMHSGLRRPAGMSTRRMEDSAYHAGFRDAVAQLERERRTPALSH